jgi:hypothetical protein
MRLAAALALAFFTLAVGGSAAGAQTADGRITGTVLAGTAGAALAPGLAVQLIVLEGGTVAESRESAVEGGRFAFDVPARSSLTYVLHLRYEGVDYVADPVILSPDERTAERDFVVYETTRDSSNLRVEATRVTAVDLSRGAGEIRLVREDLLSTAGDRVFVGDEAGVTLRLTVPEGTTSAIQVDGLTGEARRLEFGGGVVAVSGPVYPGQFSSIVTDYIVRYDPAADRYRLRVTAPAPTAYIEVRVPDEFARRVRPLEEARLGEPVTVETAEGPVTLTVAYLAGDTPPGRGLLVDLEGLALVQRVNPLTEQPGAAVAAIAALAALAVAVAAAQRLRRAA